MLIHGNALSRVNRCSCRSIDFQTPRLHPESQPPPSPRGMRKLGRDSKRPAGRNPATTPRSAACRRQGPRCGPPRLALTASRCAEPGRGAGGGLRLPGALHSSLNAAKFPGDGYGQLINSKGSELDISWLLSLCLIVLAAGVGREPGTVGWTRKELGVLQAAFYCPCDCFPAVLPRGFRGGGLLAEGWVPGSFGAPSAIWALPVAGSRADRVPRAPESKGF